MNKMKFVLCRGQGGINDNLTQIENCWRYAELSGRTLIIDTKDSGGFSLPFGRFFKERVPQGNTVFHPSLEHFEMLEKLSVKPNSIFKRINNYKPIYLHKFRNFADKDTEERLSFDFSKSYTDDVLLHDQCGGNITSLNLLARLKMTSEFREDVLQRLNFLAEGPYQSIAIRHSTDYKTDYKAVFERIYKRVQNKRLLVCSDSREVIDYAYSFFNETTILSFPSLDINNENIPYARIIRNLDEDSKYKMVVKAFADLIGLSSSYEFFQTRLISGGIKGVHSGFVLLAGNLFKNKNVIQQLMSE